MFINIFPTCKKKENKKYEEYSFTPHKTLIGNLFIGETYIEPYGISTIRGYDTGFISEIDNKQRGWSGKGKEVIHGVIMDQNRDPKYHIDGRYSDNIVLKNLKTGEEKVIWKCPIYPENHRLMYGMSGFSL